MKIGNKSWISTDAIIEQPENITIGNNVQVMAGVVLRPENGYIIIGNDVIIDHYSVIHAKGGVEIGDWCRLSPHCGIYAQDQIFDSLEMPISKQPSIGLPVTLMGDNWLGAHSIIAGGVTLGKGTAIAAGSVVCESFPMAKVVAGNPAHIIKDRIPQETWNFEVEERCSIEKTPEKYWEYINNRGKFCSQHLTPGDIVLDIGCGEGYITNIIKNSCKKVIGIDYSHDAIEKTRQRFGIEAYHMSCTNLEFPDETFDKVIFTEILEHLTRLQGLTALKEAKRVLKPGGKLIGSTPLRSTPESFPATYSHIYEYSKEELQELLVDWCNVSICNPHFEAQKNTSKY
ncbi:methyltransferase domain-containing protein [Geobacter sulfurreducens]|uniref:methyltransferase domain-containing protein n=1 Tax=Geobacter sulfurreducens TaxID=35554 RepID=UPI002C63D0F3|nr:methyltransferase domain-containing protein [Geobacter sulfurreducens]HML76847.1 methyltransferase domain-containing protein [Geobacter sulfurreducens]